MLKRCGVLSILVATVIFQVSATGISSETARGGRLDPVEKEIEGWKVHVDPALLEECRAALDELTGLLGLGSVYDFQR